MEKMNITTFQFWGLIIGFFLLTLTGSSFAQSTQDSSKTIASTEHLNNAEVSQDSNPPITLELDQVSLEEALKRIASQAEAGLYYNSAFLPKKTISLSLKAVPLDKALKKVLEGISLKIITSGRNITLRQKSETDLTQHSLANIQETITGTVTDGQSGETLPGVNILVKGTTTGISTDTDGNFELEVPSLQDTLVVTYIGYQRKEVPINGRTELNIELAPEAIMGEEMVVVGYGTQERATLTGAIETVDSEAFESRSVSNPALSLQGVTPGLTVTRSSSRPGNEGIDLQIRGVTSVNGGSPLIVIDGVPALNDNALYNMNSDDIESISVLKDGAASIYGSRAANGVVMVTTKRGSGDLQFSFSSQFRMNQIGIKPTNPTMEEYASVFLEAVEQDGETRDLFGWQSIENLERMQRGEEGIYPTEFWGDMYVGNYPRFEQMYGPSYSNEQKLSVSGGGENSNYRLSLGYLEDVGSLAPAYDGKQQYNIRLNYDYDVADWFKIESGVSYFNSTISSPSGGLNVTSMANDPPFWPAQNPYGQWLANFNTAGNRNSVSEVVDGGRSESGIDQLRVSLKGIIDFTENLNLETTASVDQEFYRNQSYSLNVSQYTWFGEETQESINSTTSINESRNWNAYQNYGGFLNYKQEVLENHSVSAMLGITAELYQDENLNGYRQGLQDYGVYDLNLGSEETNVTNSGGEGHDGFLSYIARFNYDYKDKYLLELSGRRDASSKFHPDHRWSNFYSGSVGWVVTEENFMENIEPLSFLKFKASYGEMGNQSGIGRYDYLSTIGFGTSVFGVPASNQNSAWVGGLTSLDRTWERVGITNVGTEFRLLEDQLFGSFDYFIKRNNGMLININYPDVLGGGAPATNSGELETKGWEAQLGWRQSTGDFQYSVSVNMSDTRNELIDMEGVSVYNAGLNSTVQGYPLDSYFLYQTDGFFENQDEVDSYYDNYSGELPSSSESTTLRPGDSKKIDLDGDGSIEGTGNINEGNGDVAYMGDTAPHYTYGINLSGRYKNFDLTAFFQGVLEQNIVRTGHMAYPMYPIWSNQTPAYLGKTWTPDRRATAYPRMTTNGDRAQWNWANNDLMLQNNRYIRLKSLVIGYSIPGFEIGGQNINRLRVYFSGNDLFEFTSIKDGFDPEYGESTHNSYPFTRTFSLGIDISF